MERELVVHTGWPEAVYEQQTSTQGSARREDNLLAVSNALIFGTFTAKARG